MGSTAKYPKQIGIIRNYSVLQDLLKRPEGENETTQKSLKAVMDVLGAARDTRSIFLTHPRHRAHEESPGVLHVPWCGMAACPPFPVMVMSISSAEAMSGPSRTP